jgi:tetratricopeptide (TPR) repeat protein
MKDMLVAQPGNLPENPTLSVCMIVRDEERMLPRCLKSLQDVADELIVVDTGSKDNTIPVAKDFGAKVFHFEWCDDFAAARNESLKHASCDWILQIDADEVLLPQSIPHLKNSMLKSRVLLHVIRCDNGPKSTIMRYHWVGRLFRRHPRVQYDRPYHEGVHPSVESLIAKEGQWMVAAQRDVVIRHYGYEDSLLLHRKGGKAIPIMQSYLNDNPDDWYMLARLGNTYFVLGNFQEAESSFRSALRLNPKCEHVNYFLGIMLRRQERLEEAIQCYQKAIASDPYLAEAHANLAEIYMHKEMFEQAIWELNTALAINPELSWGRSLLAEAHALVGGIYVERGMPDKAIAELKESLAVNPELAIGLSNLGFAYVLKGMYDEGIAELKKATAIDPDLASAHLNLAMAYVKKGMLDDSLRELEIALSIDPKYGKAHLNLAVVYYKKGNNSKAIKHCDTAVELGANVHPQLEELLKPFR